MLGVLLSGCVMAVALWPLETGACGGTFVAETGVIKSPRFPKRYPHNSHCVYNILASSDARLKLTCTKLNIESSLGCTKDYLKINGIIYCGKTAPKNIYGEGQLTLEFVSDGSKNRKPGFSCEYQRVTGGPFVENTTPIPTTVAPTTAAPTTASSTTAAPTTASSTTAAPTTAVPTTASSTTAAPTTSAPTTAAPTTPTTASSTTASTATTAPTTASSTTIAPTTPAPTTAAPTTEESASCESLLTTVSAWNAGWHGKVTLPIPTPITSWTIVFEFTDPLTTFEQWTGTTTMMSSTRYSVSKDNSPMSAGENLSLDFLYRFTEGSTVPSIKSIELNDQNMCNIEGSLSSTPQPTTGITETTVTQAPYTGPGCAAEGSSYNYDEVLHKSLLFYEAQRSGDLPASQRVTWRKDSATNDSIDDDTQQQVDLEGGYYDAGDYVKFGYPMAAMTTVLAWGAVEYGDAYTAAGEMSYMEDAVKWSTDYFIKAHPEPNVFYGQVGDGDIDHAYWGRPEDMTMSRPAFKITTSKPGSDLAGETAAALAAAYVLFKDSDPSYAATCLQHAEELYNFANQYKGKYADSISDAAAFYNSWGVYDDELAWAAAWLYRATSNRAYLTDAKNHYSKLPNSISEFSWAEKTPGVQVLLAEYADESDKSTYLNDLETFCDKIVDSTQRTPKGLVFISQWGSLRYAANAVFICLRAADLGISPSKYREFGKQQIHYMLGDGGRSYVVGFGNNPPERPHHASSSCPLAPTPCEWSTFSSSEPNAHVLNGALVGGPDANDNYEDKRDDYIKNEVTTDYNAGFQSAVAALRSLANCVNKTATSGTDVMTTQTSSAPTSTSTLSTTDLTTAPTSSISTSTDPNVPTVGNGTYCKSLLAVKNSWNTGWNGMVNLPIGTSINEWTLEIEFTSPINSFQQYAGGNAAMQSNTHYIVTKENAPMSPGDLLAVDILYRFDNGPAIPSIASIKFNGQTYCVKEETTTPAPPSGGYTCAQVKVNNEWQSTIQMDLTVTFPVAVSAWDIVLTFSDAIDSLQAYTAVESAVSGSSITLSNENYNGHQEAGASLVLGMQVTYSANKPTLSAISVGGIDICVDYQ